MLDRTHYITTPTAVVALLLGLHFLLAWPLVGIALLVTAAGSHFLHWSAKDDLRREAKVAAEEERDRRQNSFFGGMK